MSNLRLLSGLLILSICALAAADAQDSQKAPGPADCAKYYEHRVAHLLGCCGDLELGYEGPALAVPRSDEQRGKLALAEVQSAIAGHCLEKNSIISANILLDRVGAYLLLVSAALHQGGGGELGDVTSASENAKKAGYYLGDFITTHPAESKRSWAWIAEAFKRAGEPWKALSFLNELPAECCNKAGVSRAKGDLLFGLGLEAQAAASYAQWLTGEAPSTCAWQESQANVSILKRRGFSFDPNLAKGDLDRMSVPCVERETWLPYVRMVADPEHKHISSKGSKNGR